MFELIKNSENVADKIEQFLDIVWEVPMWNSKFQNQKVVVDWMKTPERAYRHSALRIQNRLNALSECETNLKKKDIEIRRKIRKIGRLKTEQKEDWDLDVELLEVEIEENNWHKATTKKMVKDCIVEINDLLPIINAVWKLSRKDFEAGEDKHFFEVHNAVLEWKNDSYALLKTIEKWENDLYNNIIKWKTNLKLN